MQAIKRILFAGNGAFAVIAVMIAFVLGTLVWNAANPVDYIIYTVKGTSYAKGTVLQVTSSDVE